MGQINVSVTAASAVDAPAYGFAAVFAPTNQTIAVKNSSGQVTVIGAATGSAAGVESLNSATGALTIAASGAVSIGTTGSTITIYAPTASGGGGASAASGVIHVGSGTPSDSIGVGGDFYLDQSGTNKLYGPRAASTWGTADIDAQTAILLHFDGNANDSSFQVNTAATATAAYASGHFSQCVDFSGGGFVSFPSISNYDFGSGDFTIDFWLRFPAIDIYYLINRAPMGISDWYVAMVNSNLRFEAPTQGISLDAPHGMSPNAWGHVALVRSGTTFTWYANGVNVGSTTSSAPINYNPSFALVLGGVIGAPTTYKFTGQLDEVRISKGVARWTSNFTPPTQPYTNGQQHLTLVTTNQILTGAATAGFDANYPGVTGLNAGWIQIKLDDGSTAYMPYWK